ncbi:MAG: hypothetical protein E7282_02850 [Lachnospiraceae bacterium]|nr:hypothetical protein [Lachnospiraceae bacterium]
MKREIICGLVVATLSCGIFDGASIFAADNVEQENVVQLQEGVDLDNLAPDVQAVVIKDDSIVDFEKDEIDELLDDGVQIVDFSSEPDEIEEMLECQDIDSDKNVIGYKIEKEAQEVKVTPIGLEMVSDDGQVVDEEFSQSAIDEIQLDISDDEALFFSTNKNVIPEECDDFRAHLQASNNIGSAYAETSRTTYFYRLHWYNHETKAAKKGECVSGRKMGYATVTLSAYSAGGKGKKRYDTFWTTALVGAANDYKLLNFTVQNRLYEQNNCSIIDASVLESGQESKTVSIGSSISASETGLSSSLSSGFSYTYDPNGLTIKNKTNGGDEMMPIWECSKKRKDASENEYYTIKPAIVVKSPNGKNKPTKVSARVKNLTFSGAAKDYTVANGSGSEYVYLEVKNHKN